MWEALRFSASDEFVRQLPQGLDTVGPGHAVIGGERQRIVLARVQQGAYHLLSQEREGLFSKLLNYQAQHST